MLLMLMFGRDVMNSESSSIFNLFVGAYYATDSSGVVISSGADAAAVIQFVVN